MSPVDKPDRQFGVRDRGISNIDCVGLHYSWYSQGIYQLDKW